MTTRASYPHNLGHRPGSAETSRQAAEAFVPGDCPPQPASILFVVPLNARKRFGAWNINVINPKGALTLLASAWDETTARWLAALIAGEDPGIELRA